MQELHAESNPITSLLGLEAQPALQSLYLDDCPLTQHPFYAMMCCLAVGPALRKLDGKAINEVRREVLTCHPAAAVAVRAGWIFDGAVRTADEWDELESDYRRGIVMTAWEEIASPLPPRTSTPSSAHGFSVSEVADGEAEMMASRASSRLSGWPEGVAADSDSSGGEVKQLRRHIVTLGKQIAALESQLTAERQVASLCVVVSVRE